MKPDTQVTRTGLTTALILFGVLSAGGEQVPVPKERVPVATMLENRTAVADATALYTLYIPRGLEPDGKHPTLLIFDPRGRARMAAELFQPAADRFGWILLSSNDSRSDGPWEPNLKAMRALWSESHRFAIADPSRVYATGFSGGGMLAWDLAQRTKQVAGVISVGSRLARETPTENIRFVHWGAAGSWDFNYTEMKVMDELLAREGVPHRLELFDGPHRWFGPELASEAVAWMELQAMRRGLKERDESLVEALWLADVVAAEALHGAENVLAAQRRWASIAATFDGLRDVTVAQASATRLAQDPRWRRALKEERRWDAADERYMREQLQALLAVRQQRVGLSAERLKRELDLERLQKQAAGEGYAATAAKRMLHRVYTQASFYLPRELLAAARWPEAEMVLEVAVEVKGDYAHVWYNLACAAAQTGHLDRSLQALEMAVERGFADADFLDSDPDLEPLRESEEHAQAWAQLRAQLRPERD
jgi:dienelactone hydrolase